MNDYTKDKKQSLYLLIALICTMIITALLFNIAGYSYGRYVTILIVAISIFLSVDHIYCVIIFCLPFASMLKLGAATISILPILYLVVLAKLLFIQRVRVNNLAFSSVLLIALLQLIYVISYGANITSVLSMMLSIVFIMFSASYFRSHTDEKNSLITTASIFLLVATALNILISDIFPDIPYMINYEKQVSLDYDNRFGALYVEPNELAQIILISVGLFVSVFKNISNKTARVALLCTALYIAINGIRTNSKSYVLVALVLIVFSFIMYLAYTAKKKGSGAAILKLLPVLIILVAVSSYFYASVLAPVFEERGATGADILSDRGEVWNNYLSLLMQRLDILLVGYGIGNVPNSLKLIGISTNVVPHNLYIEFVIQFGLIGLFALAIAWTSIWKSISKKAKTLFLLPILAFAATSLAISANSSDCLYILLLILSMPLTDPRENQSKI